MSIVAKVAPAWNRQLKAICGVVVLVALVMRKLFSVGKPRVLQDHGRAVLCVCRSIFAVAGDLHRPWARILIRIDRNEPLALRIRAA
jgi:hypothetical protein